MPLFLVHHGYRVKKRLSHTPHCSKLPARVKNAALSTRKAAMILDRVRIGPPYTPFCC